MPQTKLTVLLLLLAFGVLAGCQGDRYWRANQRAEINAMDRDTDGRHQSAYDSRDNTTGFAQDNYWGGSEPRRSDVYAYPSDRYTSPRETYPRETTPRETYPRETSPRDTSPRTTPRDPNLVD